MPITFTQPAKEEIKDEKSSSFSKTKNETKQKRAFKTLEIFLIFQMMLKSFLSVWLNILDLHSPLTPSSFASIFTDYWPDYFWFDYDYFIRLLGLSLETTLILCVLWALIINDFRPEKASNDVLIHYTSNPDNIFDKHQTLITFYLILAWIIDISKELPVLLYPFFPFLFPNSEIDPVKTEYQFCRWLPNFIVSFLFLLGVLYLLIHYLRNPYGLQNRAGVKTT